ncbi:hypothetical protein BKA81DRAFT_363 [Phyllosticta paracitricarpa]
MAARKYLDRSKVDEDSETSIAPKPCRPSSSSSSSSSSRRALQRCGARTKQGECSNNIQTFLSSPLFSHLWLSIPEARVPRSTPDGLADCIRRTTLRQDPLYLRQAEPSRHQPIKTPPTESTRVFFFFFFFFFFLEKSANPPAIQAQPVVRPPTGTLTTQWLSTRLHPSTALMEPRAYTLTKLQQPTRARQHTRAQSQAQLSSSGRPQKAKPRANEASHITNQARPISSRHAADRPFLALRHANGAAKLRQPRFPTA